MTEEKKSLSTWILLVSGLFALLETGVSLALWLSPGSLVDKVDLTAKGVGFLVNMWAARQFALGFIFAFATFKRSAAMLTIAYVFFLVMMVADLFIGITYEETGLIIGAAVMCIVSSVLILAVNRRKS